MATTVRPVSNAVPASEPGIRAAQIAALVNLILQMAIVVTGAIVRLTDSGLGCPEWPTCAGGSVVPTADQAEGYHKLIEFGNRTLTGVVLLGALAALITVWRTRRLRLRIYPAAVVFGVFLQAAIGGVTVLTDLAPQWVGIHLLVSMALITISTVLYIRLRSPAGSYTLAYPRPAAYLAFALGCAVSVVVILGVLVTASGPHSGATSEAERLDWDPRALSWLHADSVMLFVGLLFGLAVLARLADVPNAARSAVTTPTNWLLVVVAVQAAVGYTQYFNGLPIVLVAIHVALATSTVVLTTAAIHGMFAVVADDIVLGHLDTEPAECND